MTQHEHGALPSFESIDGGSHSRPAFPAEQPRFGVGIAAWRTKSAGDRAAIVAAFFLVRRHQPALAANAGLPAIEAAVDENTSEPDFERPSLTVRSDMTEDFDERVLDGFVGLGGVAKVLIGNPQGSPLVGNDETFELLTGRVEIAAFDQCSKLDREPRIVGQRNLNWTPRRARRHDCR
jgi:hypothetical protein